MENFISWEHSFSPDSNSAEPVSFDVVPSPVQSTEFSVTLPSSGSDRELERDNTDHQTYLYDDGDTDWVAEEDEYYVNSDGDNSDGYINPQYATSLLSSSPSSDSVYSVYSESQQQTMQLFNLQRDNLSNTRYHAHGDPDVPTEGLRQKKNMKERCRVQEKREVIEELIKMVKESPLIDESEKNQRFTEGHTVIKTTELIQLLEEKLRKLPGRIRRHRQFSGRIAKNKRGSSSNAFINFSSRFRPCFVESCGAHVVTGKNPSQKVVLRLAADVWHELPQSTKATQQEWESQMFKEQVRTLTKTISRMPSHLRLCLRKKNTH